MVEPGLVIDAVGELKERDEILGFQVETLVRAAKEKAPIGPELACRILAQVPPALPAGSIAPKRHWRRLRRGRPKQGLARLRRFSSNARHGLSGRFAKAPDHAL